MDGRKVTVLELKKALNSAIEEGIINDGATILWSDMASEGDRYCREYDVAPGTLLLGLEYFNDGIIEQGTLQIQPSKMSDQLN